MGKTAFEQIASFDESVWRSGLDQVAQDFSEPNCSALIGVLSDKIWRKREAVAKVILNWGDRVVPIILKRFSEKNMDHLYWCLFILGHFSQAEATAKVLEFLTFPVAEVRGYAARALSLRQTIENARNLFPLLNDPNWSVRKLVFSQLLQFGELLRNDLDRILCESKEELTHSYVALYVKIGGEGIFPRLRELYQQGTFSTRYSIVVALSDQQNNHAVDFLISALGDPSWIIRKKAGEILTAIGTVIFERLSMWFGKSDSGTKSQIISIIVQIYGERALPIIRRLLSSQDDELRLMAIESLAQLPGVESSRLLIESLGDSKRMVSDYASECLARKDKLNLDLLLEHLESEDENVRFLVIKVIGSIGGVALNPIIHILQSGKKDEKLFLLGVLQRIVPNDKLISAVIDLLSDEAWPIRNAAGECLKSFGERCVGAVIRVLNSHSDDVQFWARRILLSMGKAAVDSLTRVLDDGSDLALIPHVISALLAMSHADAVPAVIHFLEKNDDSQVQTVFQSIEEIASREVLETIMNLLNHPDDRVVKWLSTLLQKVRQPHLRKIVLLGLNIPSDRSRRHVLEGIKGWKTFSAQDVNIFVRQLEVEKSPESIRLVIMILSSFPPATVIGPLQGYLLKCPPDLMLDLMMILADCPEGAYEAMLAEMLRNRSEVIRTEDIERVGPILGKIFRKKPEGILQGMSSPSLAFRLCCVVALEQVRENRIVFSLMDSLNLRDDPAVVKRAVKILLRSFFSDDFRLKGAVTDYLLGLGTVIQDPVNQMLPTIENDIDRKALVDLLESVGGTVDPDALVRKKEKKVLLSDSKLDDVLEKRKKAIEELEKIETIIQSSHTQELAIMFTDVKGYTAFSSKASLSEVMGMLKDHDEMLIPIIEKNEGKILKKIGDAFMVIFEQTNKAILAAMAIQRSLRDHNKGLSDERRLAVRIAINYGPVIRRENDVFGDAVNLASRIEGLADAEEIVISEFAAVHADRKVFELSDFGEHRVKGIEYPVRLFKVSW
jgi:class 3 adenylate cyclase/HEAT repeat protein